MKKKREDVTAERRKFNRYPIHSDEIQVAVHPNRKIYSIKNIGKGGMAIEYGPVADEPFEPETIDIIAIDYDRFYLPELACKTIYDIGTLMEGGSFRGGERRICGLKFVGLTREKEEKLDMLLNRCLGRSV